MKEDKRLADDAIYLNEDRFGEPKEMFKFILSLLRSRLPGGIKTFLDVGCATGEFIHFMRGALPNIDCTGVDISAQMITQAKKVQPSVEFITGDISSGVGVVEGKYDLVCCIGVLQIFDDVRVPLQKLLDRLRPGGCLCIAGSFNNHNVDVLMRYREGGKPDNIWETGWNLFSKQTFERYLVESSKNIDWEWHDFEMPFALPERADPMRSWTLTTEQAEHQLVNGAAQLLFTKVLLIQDMQPAPTSGGPGVN